jgi:hypothetical protein
MFLLMPVLTWSLLMLPVVRVGENVRPESPGKVTTPGIWRSVSAPPGNVGRCPKYGVGKYG